MNTTTPSKVVFTGTWDWYEIVSRDEEIVTDDDNSWPAGSEEACSLAGVDLDDSESWCVKVKEVAERHSAIRPGDLACCEGYGCDVTFVRTSPVASEKG